MATELPKDSKAFLSLLGSNGDEYLLIAGYAVGHHGYPRATGDMDRGRVRGARLTARRS